MAAALNDSFVRCKIISNCCIGWVQTSESYDEEQKFRWRSTQRTIVKQTHLAVLAEAGVWLD